MNTTPAALTGEIVAVNVDCQPEKGSQELAAEAVAILERAGTYAVITNQEQLSQGNECLARLREARGALEKKRVFMKAPSLEAGARVDAMFKPRLDALDAMIRTVSGGTTAYMRKEQQRLEEEERARRRAEQERLTAEAEERRKQEQAQREEADRQRQEAQAKLDEAAALEAKGDVKGSQAALEAASAAEQQAESATAQADQGAQEAAGLTQAAEAVVAAPVEVAVRSTGTLGSKAALKKVRNYKIVDITKVPEQFLVPPEERLNKTLVRANMNANVPIEGIEYYDDYTTATRTSKV